MCVSGTLTAVPRRGGERFFSPGVFLLGAQKLQKIQQAFALRQGQDTEFGTQLFQRSLFPQLGTAQQIVHRHTKKAAISMSILASRGKWAPDS